MYLNARPGRGGLFYRRTAVIYSESEARRLICEAGLRLLDEGLAARTWGNISARTGVDEFIITPSGRDYRDLGPDDLVRVRISDCSYEGRIKPSSEKGVHAAAYALRDNADFVIHTHQKYASAVAAELRDVSFAPCAEYAAPGSQRLRKNIETTISALPDADAFLMARHGALLLAEDMETAFALAEELEDKSRSLVNSRMPETEAAASEAADLDRIRCEVLPYLTVVSDEGIMACCREGVTVGAYLDDFAMIAGPDISVVDNEPETIRRALLGYNSGRLSAAPRIPLTGVLNRRGGMHPALNALIGRNAVLVRGVGAVCAGGTQEDADAAAMIVSKNCLAACYVRRAEPLSALEARRLRYSYMTGYSRLRGR